MTGAADGGNSLPERAERPPRAGRNRASAFGRREALAALASGVLGGLAGCSFEPSFPDVDVVAGSGGRLAFEPAELTVSAGETVTWGFASGGHNVSCRPNDSGEVALPDGAAPFASYGPGESPEGSLVPRGETYEHAFDATGKHVYVCVPHVAQGMTGTIRVE